MRTTELKFGLTNTVLEKMEKFQKRLHIENCETWEEISGTVMNRLESYSNELDTNITQEDIEYILYKDNLLRIENFIPQLINKMKYIEETKVLEDVGKIALPALKKNLYDMIKIRDMYKEEDSVLMKRQCIIDLKEYLDFVKYMFFLE